MIEGTKDCIKCCSPSVLHAANIAADKLNSTNKHTDKHTDERVAGAEEERPGRLTRTTRTYSKDELEIAKQAEKQKFDNANEEEEHEEEENEEEDIEEFDPVS